jgi:histidyl-tRNA synthetase
MNRSVKAQFKYADKINAKYVITLGDNELQTKRAQLKDMTSGEAIEIDISDEKDILSKLKK